LTRASAGTRVHGNLANILLHFARAKRSKHDLSEDLELGIEKNLTGISAFTSLFDEVWDSLFEAEDADGKTKSSRRNALALMHSRIPLRTRIYSKF
jgi:hypothetical protein